MKFIYILCLLSFASLGHTQCLPESHSSFSNQGWKSCAKSTNPIPENGNTHWIKYDLGEQYVIDSIQIWNHNVWGETGKGIRDVRLDYSNDNMSWTSGGIYSFDKAPGSWKYISEDIQYVGNIQARYFLFTVISTWDDLQDCAGIAEIKFVVGEKPTSIEEQITLEDLQLFPNPTYNYLNLQWDNTITGEGQLEIYDAFGRKTDSSAIPLNQGNVTKVISAYHPGAYNVRITIGKTTLTKNFIKM